MVLQNRTQKLKTISVRHFILALLDFPIFYVLPFKKDPVNIFKKFYTKLGVN